ncbi:hypothetical protein AKJ09_08507 [Labilithrix luteola]|uniref:Uncharacterized protein n=1 Tax=Labilithrix luteola TaxID=1391654 RepID=A0A0K1Q7Z3_9BACT|nr:hypothetical protein AKJ09_08507 [Labilithrix luteola]
MNPSGGRSDRRPPALRPTKAIGRPKSFVRLRCTSARSLSPADKTRPLASRRVRARETLSIDPFQIVQTPRECGHIS